MLSRISLSLLLLAACSEYTPGLIGGPSTGPGNGNGGGAEPACEFPAPQAYDVARDEDCIAEPEVGTFTPVVEWAWNNNPIHGQYHQVMMTPVVDHLTDDNGDGVLGEGDSPDVVFMAFKGDNYKDAGKVVGVSGLDGSTLFSWDSFEGCQPRSSGGIAIGDLDGDGEPSLVFLTTCGLASVDRRGMLEWLTPLPDNHKYDLLWAPSLADLNADGRSEVMMGRVVLDYEGTVLWEGNGTRGWGVSFAADLDQDGMMEVIAGGTVYETDGTIRWSSGIEGFSGVADLDLDGQPEVIVVETNGDVHAYTMDGVELWEVRFTQDERGGAPTLADFDGDGFPEIGVAFSTAYRVLEGDGAVLWSQPTIDRSSGITGSAVFDFEGDGAAEVVYGDEFVLYVYDGATGTIEMEYEDHSSGTLIEYPVIVDIDGDDSAEIVLPSNNYRHAGITGITVIGDEDSSWAPARQVWNQHAYHVTNIKDDSTIPSPALHSWLEDNTFRAGNTDSYFGLDRPDLQIGELKQCLDECQLDRVVVYVPIENGGLVDTMNVDIALYTVGGDGEANLFDQWTVPLVAQGESVWAGPMELPGAAFGDQGALLRVDDNGAGSGFYEECDETNNEYTLPKNPCLE